MTLQEVSNGSGNYILKNRRIVAPYLTAIYRRKLLFVTSLSVCLSFLIVAWYSNKEAKNGLQSERFLKNSPTHLSHLDEHKSGGYLAKEKPPYQNEHDYLDEYDLKSSKSTPDVLSSLESTEDYSYENAAPPPGKPRRKTKKKINANLSKESNDESLKMVSSRNKTKMLLDFITPKGSGVSGRPAKSAHLVLDTNGCKIPKLDPWDPSVIELIQLQTKPYVCAGPPLLMKGNTDGSLTLNETVLLVHHDMRPHHIKCYYQPVYREHEFPNNPFETGYSAGNVTTLEFGVPLNAEFIGSYCDLYGKYYYQYFAFPLLKPEVEKDRETRSPPEHRLNVILVGIDSVSKLNFLRHFKRTRSFLKNTIRPFSMRGYNKVGDNTFPNLVPMLTGRFVEHYFNESMQLTYYFDDLDLIWKDYAKRGYRTFYAEDSPHIGTFNYLKRGFYEPPTDYYLRTLLLAMEFSPNKPYTTPFCANSILETDLIYDYLRDFIKVMDTRPYHAFAMVSKITHDLINYAGYSDEPTVHLLEDLWNSGTLNNSVLFLFSDHGIRYGEIRNTYIGKFEEKMPFMYIHFPQWFLEQHPDMARNLETNQERLMTLFDVHATMLHLLDLDQDMTSPEKRSVTLGSSLLQEISPDRTCEEANIKEHFCSCQSYQPVPVGDSYAKRAAEALVDNINTQLTPFNKSCAHLEVDNILDARVNHADLLPDAFGNLYQPHTDYLVTLVTRPGEAVFDGTVRYDPFTGGFRVLGISRINMYRDQSKCIDSQKMKIFCFCNS